MPLTAFDEMHGDGDGVTRVEDYPDNLRLTLDGVAPSNLDREPTVLVLMPGTFNSAYFEHSFLADQMGVELVEGQDLVVVDGALRMKTTEGLKQVDVVYRRVDDSFAGLDSPAMSIFIGTRSR